MRAAIERFFELRERQSMWTTELLAGATTFVTMAYILFVNPAILGAAADPTGHTLDRAAVLTSTALIAGIATIAMGIAARLPIALAPGMGLNAVVAFQLVAGMHLTWPEAMGVIVAEGIIISLLVLTGFRQAVMEAIPLSLKRSIAVGIGLFLALIGLVNAGFISRPEVGPVPVRLGTGYGLRSIDAALFVLALLVTAALVARKVRAGLLIGMAVTTAVAFAVRPFAPDAWGPGVAQLPEQLLAWPRFEQVGQFSFGFFRALGVATAAVTVFSIMLSDFFDTMGTVVAVGRQARYIDDQGRIPRLGAVLMVDSLAAVGGGAVGASSATSYIESAAGAAAGGRTGLTSVVCGLLFLVALVLSPFAAVVPPQATGAVLVIVGFQMMQDVGEIPWGEALEAIPAFLAMIVMPFTYSITNGIGAGIVAYTVLAIATGKVRQIHALLWACTAAFVVYFALGAG